MSSRIRHLFAALLALSPIVPAAAQNAEIARRLNATPGDAFVTQMQDSRDFCFVEKLSYVDPSGRIPCAAVVIERTNNASVYRFVFPDRSEIAAIE